MDFFWPEKYRRDEDIDVDEMFKIVEKKRRSLLENLGGISHQMSKAPIDLLTIYAIYDVFSVKGEKWEETRKWFVDRYKNRLRYYLKNEKSLPEYRNFVWKLFHDLFDMKLKNEIEKMDLDSYFAGNDTRFLVSDAKVGEEVKSWDNFRDVLVRMCRELFPYAEKRFDNTLYTKSFKNEILDLFFKEKKEEILGILSELINDTEKLIDESREYRINDLKMQILESGASPELLAMLDLVENGEGKIFLEIDGMVKVLSVFDSQDFDIRGDFLQFYIDEVVERFKNSSDKRDPVKKSQKKQSNVSVEKNRDLGFERVVNLGETMGRISSENEEIIDNIVQYCKLDKKDGKTLKKYLERLLVNGKNCRMSSLTKLGITEIEDNLRVYFQKLGIVVEYDTLDKEKDSSGNVENLDNINEDVVKIGNIVDVKDSSSLDNSDICEDVVDPFSIIFEQAKKYNYEIFNERRLKKHFEELCKTDDELKKVLCIEMKKDSFGNPKKKQGRNYYTIEIAVTGLRFLLFKDRNGKFIIDGLYNHDDYDKRVKEL